MRVRSRSLVLTLVTGALLSLLGGTAAFGMARGTAFAPCLSSPGGWKLFAEASGSGLDEVTVTGFDPRSCDGLDAVVTIRGNDDGVQAAPASSVYGTWSTSRDSCTGASRTTRIRDGRAVLVGCPGRLPSAHAITQFHIQVASQAIVLGEALEGTPSGGPIPRALLPLTGAPNVLLARVGLLVTLVGLVVWAGGRRREKS